MKILKRLLFDESGVSVLVEYILIIGVLALIMAFLIPQLNALMSKLPTTNAMSNQFRDVASEISAQITDMLLIAPKNGVIKSKVHMPYSIGKHTYGVEIENGNLIVKSNLWTQKADLGKSTLGFITKGRTFSDENSHELILNSSIHFLPTAVAIAYPTEALVGENVTFDMTHSYGQGTLYYRWIFGDGSSTENWIKYDPLNPSSGIIRHKYNYKGNYTAILEVKDSLGYISTDKVEINVTEQPKVGLYVDKYVVPSTITPGGTSTINIFLFGNGINQTSLNVTVIHTIDCSGSMDWYTPLSSFTGDVTSKAGLVNFTINNSRSDYMIFATTNDFDSFYIQYSVRPISMFVASPSGSYVQASDVWNYNYQNGYGYIITNPQTGVWKIALNDLNPQNAENIKIYVFKGTYWGFTFVIDSIIYQGNVTVYPDYKLYGIRVPKEATRLGVQLSPIQTPTTLYLWLRDNISGTYTLAVANNNVAWINITNPSTGYTAYVVPSLPPSSNSNFYLNAYIPKIDAAKIAAKTFDALLRKHDFVGVVKFNWYYATYVVNPPTNDTAFVNSSIDSITADGATPMASGISYAISELKSFNDSKNKPAVNVIILLSDGNPNIDLTGNHSIRKAIEDSIKEAYVAKSYGYIIYTIGYGIDANATLLKQIAEITGGKYYFAANAQELESIYKSIARDVLTKAAENITVTDVVPKDIEVVSASNAKITKTDNGTIVSWSIPVVRINQSWLGTITITTSKTGQFLTDVANVSNVTYFNVVNSKIVTIPLPVKKLNVTITKSASFNLR